MSKLSVSLLAVMVVAALRALAAAPTHGTHLQVGLREALDTAVCPIRVEYDEDPARVPRRIKMLKCGATPNPMCQSMKLTHACCRSHHHGFNTECVELTDTVQVRYSGRGDDAALHPFTASVGCACLVRPHAAAVEDS